MTTIEQLLTYITNETRFMAGSGVGTPHNAAYADRVIQDVCGLRTFCSTLLASSKPSVVIMSALQGPKGNLLIRFFDEQLHQARIELVSLLHNAATRHYNKHEYQALLKLYKKSIKKARKLVDPKGLYKATTLDEYPGLQALTGLGSSILDDEDEDDEFAPFDSYSDYADAYMDALRNGTELPRPLARPPKKGLDLDLTGNDDVLQTLERIQRKMGRQLTPAETVQLIQIMGQEEEEDETEEPELQATSPDMTGLINQVAQMVLAKLAMNGTPVAAMTGDQPKFSDLDELLDYAEQHRNDPAEEPDPSEDDIAPETVTIDPQPRFQPKPPDVKPNKQINDPDQLSTGELIQAKNRGDFSGLEESSESQEEAPSESQGPDVESGPNLAQAVDAFFLESTEDTTPTTTAANLEEATDTMSEPRVRLIDQLLPKDQAASDEEKAFAQAMTAVNSFDLIRDNFIDEMTGYLNQVTTPQKVDLRILPSSEPNQVLKVYALVNVVDALPVDLFRVTSIASHAVDAILSVTQLPSEAVDLETAIGTSTMTNEVQVLSPDILAMGRRMMDLSVTLALYFNDLMGPIDLRYICHWTEAQVRGQMFIGGKTNDPPRASVHTFESAITALGKIQPYRRVIEFLAQRGLAYELVLVQDEEWNEFRQPLIQMFKSNLLVQRLLNLSKEHCAQDLKHLLETYGLKPDLVDVDVRSSVITTPTEIGFDIMYTLAYQGHLTGEDEIELEQEFERFFSANLELQRWLQMISNASVVDSYFKFEDVSPKEEPTEVPKAQTEASNAFGL